MHAAWTVGLVLLLLFCLEWQEASARKLDELGAYLICLPC